jgi:hypothetical protein
VSQSCNRCQRKFDTMEDYDLHLPGCVLRHPPLRHTVFKPVQGRDPLLAQRAVVRKPDLRPTERPKWAYESEEQAVNDGLRTKRIRTIQYDLDVPTIGNRWRRLWRRIRGN